MVVIVKMFKFELNFRNKKRSNGFLISQPSFKLIDKALFMFVFRKDKYI